MNEHTKKWEAPVDSPKGPIVVTLTIGGQKVGEVHLPEKTFGVDLQWKPDAEGRWRFQAFWIEEGRST